MATPPFTPYDLRIQRTARTSEVQSELGSVPCLELPEGMHFLVSGTDHLPFAPFLEFLADKALGPPLSRSPRGASELSRLTHPISTTSSASLMQVSPGGKTSAAPQRSCTPTA